MNERHEIEVGEKDCTFELFVTRAAVKFTYRLTNQGDRDLVLTGLTIDKMARKEYYLPHGAVYEENEDGIREIVQYDAVPADYYTFVYADEANWIAIPELTGPLRVTARTRYHQVEQAATVYPAECGFRLEFDQPQRAPTPGQAVVLYQGDTVLGGGTITRVEK